MIHFILLAIAIFLFLIVAFMYSAGLGMVGLAALVLPTIHAYKKMKSSGGGGNAMGKLFGQSSMG